MSLSERDQRVLDSIEDRLVGSTPELASLLATFTRLAADEALPARERLRDERRAHRGPSLGRRGKRGGGSHPAASQRRERLRWQLVPALIWLVMSLALISVALTLNGTGKGSSPACMTWAGTCRTSTHSTSP